MYYHLNFFPIRIPSHIREIKKEYNCSPYKARSLNFAIGEIERLCNLLDLNKEAKIYIFKYYEFWWKQSIRGFAIEEIICAGIYDFYINLYGKKFTIENKILKKISNLWFERGMGYFERDGTKKRIYRVYCILKRRKEVDK